MRKNKTQLSLYLDDALAERLKQYAAKHSMTITDVIRNTLIAYLAGR